VLSVLVPQQTADDFDRSLAGDNETSYSFEAEDGQYTILLRRVVYVKRFAARAASASARLRRAQPNRARSYPSTTVALEVGIVGLSAAGRPRSSPR